MSLLLAKEWMRVACDDLLLLEEIQENSHLTAIIAFHSQQAVEKAFKALLCFYDSDIPKIHSLNKLFKLNESYIDIPDIQMLNKLDKLYVDSRYPTEFGLLPYGKPTLKDAKEFYEFAQTIFDRVCEILDIDKSELK